MKTLHLRHIIIFSLVGALIIALLFQFVNKSYENMQVPVTLGGNYSPRYAEYLGLDPKKTYLQILQELKIKRLRIPVYWDQIEPEDGRFDFKQLDYYVQQAEEQHAQLILAIGYKVPRWPECYPPKWLIVDRDNFPTDQLNTMLTAVIKRYDHSPAVAAWQVENEPFFPFGDCKSRSSQSFVDELKFVKSLTKKPIVVTDSGEFSPWISSISQSDIFGTTLYRDAVFSFLGRFYYPVQPWFYRLRSELVRKFIAPTNHKTIVIELQAEVWTADGISSVPLEQQLSLFPAERITENVHYAQRAGFDEIYLWGLEWYFYLSEHGHPEYLETVQGL